jgi:polyphosphate kinase 2 (PPK2 family)
MFESAELGHAIGKGEYDAKLPKLREALLEAQMSVLERGEFAVLLLTGGEDGGGKGEIVNTLLSWMDPRHIRVQAFPESTEGELGRPPMWRYWRDLPPKGKLGAFYGAWYSPAIEDRVYGRTGGPEFRRLLAEFSRFERMLFDEGALIVKFWLHLTKKAQRERFEKLEGSAATAWRVTKQDWRHHRQYERFREVEEVALRETSTPEAPWTIVESTDGRYRNLTIGTALLDAMRARLDRGRTATPIRAAPPPAPPIDARNVIAELDLSAKLTDAQYDRRLPKLQGRLNALSRDKRFRRHSCVIVFEGNDAAGKGWSHPEGHGRARRPQLPRHSRRGSDGGGARAAVSVALLEASATEWPLLHLRPELVRPRARRARGALCRGGGLAACLSRDRRFRAFPREARDRRREVLAGHQQGRAARALPGAREGALQALQDYSRGLAKSGEVGRV